jgi:hypothetical protein
MHRIGRPGFGPGQERTAQATAPVLGVDVHLGAPVHHAWRKSGMDALATAGPPTLPKMSDDQFAELEKELVLGPAEHGWEDHLQSVSQGVCVAEDRSSGVRCGALRGSGLLTT